MVAETNNKCLNQKCRRAIQWAADDFRSLICTLKLFDIVVSQELSSRTEIELRSLNVRNLIQPFFLELRSIFDYMLMATIICFSEKLNQEPALKKALTSRKGMPYFSDLKKKYLIHHKQSAIRCFGIPLVQLWSACGWFTDLNEWRNGIAHGGIFVSVKNESPAFFRLETVTGGYPLRRSILPSRLFENSQSNAVSFRSFSGLYLGLMIFFLNKWAEEILNQCDIKRTNRAFIGPGRTLCEKYIHAAWQTLI